jgi:hypothetical protein
MADRIPALSVTPEDKALWRNKGLFDWMRRRLGVEIPAIAMGELIAWNPPNIATSPGFTSTDVEVKGATLDVSTAQPVSVGCSQILADGAFLVANVIAQDTVRVTLVNLTGGAYNAPTIAFLRVMLWRYP